MVFDKLYVRLIINFIHIIFGSLFLIYNNNNNNNDYKNNILSLIIIIITIVLATNTRMYINEIYTLIIYLLHLLLILYYLYYLYNQYNQYNNQHSKIILKNLGIFMVTTHIYKAFEKIKLLTY